MNEGLIEIATQQPKDETALSRLRSIPKGWERSASAEELLKAVKAGLEVDLASLPPIHKHVALNNGTAAAIELLRVLLKLVADEEGIAPRIIANNDDLEKIAKQESTIRQVMELMQKIREDNQTITARYSIEQSEPLTTL